MRKKKKKERKGKEPFQGNTYSEDSRSLFIWVWEWLPSSQRERPNSCLSSTPISHKGLGRRSWFGPLARNVFSFMLPEAPSFQRFYITHKDEDFRDLDEGASCFSLQAWRPIALRISTFLHKLDQWPLKTPVIIITPISPSLGRYVEACLCRDKKKSELLPPSCWHIKIKLTAFF